MSGTAQTGAVYVYRLTGTWKLANMVKPDHPSATGLGQVVALSHTGKTLIVPVPGESSSAQGIDGDWANSDLPAAGAVFMY